MSGRVHGWLRKLLPARLRRRQGDAMAEAFATALREANASGAWAVVRLWCREALDLGRTAATLRVAAGRRPATRRRLLTSVHADLRAAIRTLRRRPAFTVFAALTMALGIAAATAVFSAIEAVVINPLPYAGADRMLALFESSGSERLLLSPTPESIGRWRAQADVFEAIEPIGSSSKRLTGQGAATTVAVAFIRPEFHTMVDRPPALGRAFTTDELRGAGDHVVLLDNAFWRSRFAASRDVLGNTLELDGEPWTIVGVMPPATVLPSFDTAPKDLWLPLSEDRQAGTTSVVALMRSGVGLEDVTARFEALHRQAEAEAAPDARVGTALLIAEQRGFFLRESLQLLALAVGLLVLIACINVANLLLGSIGRQRADMALRVALGASGANLIRQVLAQSLLLAALGGGLGMALTRAALAGFGSLRPDNLRLLDSAGINLWTLTFTMVVTLLAGMAAGMLPAAAAIRTRDFVALHDRASAGAGGGRRLRWGLISGEVALSFVLLVTSLLVAVDLQRLQGADVGFEADRIAVLSVSLPPWKFDDATARDLAWGRLEARLAGLAGIERMTLSSGVPPRTAVTWGRVAIDDQPPSDEAVLLVGPSVRADYFSTLGQRIVAGRAFTPEEVRDRAAVIILGEQAARSLMPERDPLGARLRFDNREERWYEDDAGGEIPSFTVVGVVADVAMNGPAGVPELQMYRPIHDELAGAARTFILRPAPGRDPRELLPAARQLIVAEDPDILVSDLSTGADLMLATLGRQRFQTSLLTVFAVLALVLAAVGLYGVISGLVGQRTREIGIRMALGADSRAIRKTVLSGGMVATLSGIVVGIPLLWAVSRLVASGLVADLTGAPGVYAAAVVVLVLTALIATYLPARRATRIDPLAAIRDG